MEKILTIPSAHVVPFGRGIGVNFFLTLALFVSFAGEAYAVEGAESCDTMYSLGKLTGALDGAEEAFAALDVTGFSNAMEETLLFLLPCLEEPVNEPASAQLHRMLALRAYSDRRDDLINPSLAASRRIDSAFRWPVELLPEGHEFRERYDQLPADNGSDSKPVRPPKSGELWVDGAVGTALPQASASVIQYATEEGQIAWTQYRMPGEPVRSYPIRPVVRNSLLAHGAAQLAIGLGTFAGGQIARANFLSEDGVYTRDELMRLQGQANTLTTISGVTTALAGASFGLSLVVWKK